MLLVTTILSRVTLSVGHVQTDTCVSATDQQQDDVSTSHVETRTCTIKPGTIHEIRQCMLYYQCMNTILYLCKP